MTVLHGGVGVFVTFTKAYEQGGSARNHGNRESELLAFGMKSIFDN
jgi:hypothetical protein